MNVQTPSLTPTIDPTQIDRLFDIRGQRVFVPGGYGAIGEAIALSMGRMGATVVIAGPRLEKAQALASRVGELGGAAHGVRLDAGSVESIAEATAQAITLMGGVDVLVNCVGIQREQPLLPGLPQPWYLLASVLAKGMTIIENAAKEPHIVDVANFLNSMGADVKGAGTDVIKIRGVSFLRGTTYSIIPDQIEAGMVYVNVVLADSPELPFGGVKRSGTSRELGLLAADEFVNKKLIRVG